MNVDDQLKMTAAMLLRQYGQERAIKSARTSQRQQAKLGNQAGVDGWEIVIRHLEESSVVLPRFGDDDSTVRTRRSS